MSGAASLAELERARVLLEERGGVYGRSIEILAETASTNDDARLAAERGVPRGHVVVADAQRAGRGARGAAWSSPAGTDLYVSIVERPSEWPPHAPSVLALLTLAVGLGVREACARSLARAGVEPAARLQVKWPNDVLLDGQKCAGVLVESSWVGDRIGAVIVGVGLDVNRERFPEALEGLATSLHRVSPGGAPLDRAEVLVELISSVEGALDALVRGGSEAVVAALRGSLAWVGERVRVDGTVGTLEGVDEDGALLVRDDTGALVRVRSGTLRRA